MWDRRIRILLTLGTSLSLVACMHQRLLPTDALEPSPSAAATPAAPRPDPTPAVVTPSPSPSATPTTTSCPTLLGIRIDVFATQPQKDRVVLDATPLTEQCAAFPGRLVCPLGPAGSKVRAECEAVRIGPEGPLWAVENGRASIEAIPGSGYLTAVIGRGVVSACSRVQPDVCAIIEVR
jgi:hypothetical protein